MSGRRKSGLPDLRFENVDIGQADIDAVALRGPLRGHLRVTDDMMDSHRHL